MFVVCLTFYDSVIDGSYATKVYEFSDINEARSYYNLMLDMYKDNDLVGVSADC